MLEEARLPAVDPSQWDEEEDLKEEEPKRVLILDISPKGDNEIEL